MDRPRRGRIALRWLSNERDECPSKPPGSGAIGGGFDGRLLRSLLNHRISLSPVQEPLGG